MDPLTGDAPNKAVRLPTVSRCVAHCFSPSPSLVLCPPLEGHHGPADRRRAQQGGPAPHCLPLCRSLFLSLAVSRTVSPTASLLLRLPHRGRSARAPETSWRRCSPRCPPPSPLAPPRTPRPPRLPRTASRASAAATPAAASALAARHRCPPRRTAAAAAAAAAAATRAGAAAAVVQRSKSCES
jgi:hypothetical protein